MLDRRVLRWGGLAGMTGAVVMIAVRIYSIAHIVSHHPRARIAHETDPLISELEDIAGSASWLITHWAALIGAGLMLFGIVAVALSFREEPTRSWARIALPFAIVGTVFLALNAAANTALESHGDMWVEDPSAATLAAAQGASAYATTIYVGLIATLYGAGALLLGVMTLSAGAEVRGVGWLATVGGILALVVASLLHFEVHGRLVATYLPAAARGLFYLWLLLMSWRLSSQPTRVSTPETEHVYP